MNAPAQLIDGRAIAYAVLENVAEQVRALAQPPHLAALCAGGDTGLRTFVRLKQKAAQSVGIQFSSYFFDEDDEAGARQTMEFLASDESVDGIFVELPLPRSWDTPTLLRLLPESKDVDVISPAAMSAFTEGLSTVLPPAVAALGYVLEEVGISTMGLHAAVIGAGALVGAPVAHWLQRQGAHVGVVDIDTPSPEKISSQADLVIAATGTPGLVTGGWVKPGALVIDYGYGKRGGKFVGDVDEESVRKKAGFLTPVPGGMGPIVVAAVLENLLTLATR